MRSLTAQSVCNAPFSMEIVRRRTKSVVIIMVLFRAKDGINQAGGHSRNGLGKVRRRRRRTTDKTTRRRVVAKD